MYDAARDDGFLPIQVRNANVRLNIALANSPSSSENPERGLFFPVGTMILTRPVIPDYGSPGPLAIGVA